MDSLLAICCSRLGFPHAYANGQLHNASSLPKPLTHSSSSPSIRHSSTRVLVWYTVNTSLTTTDTILVGIGRERELSPKAVRGGGNWIWGGQIRAGSGRGGNAPPSQLGETVTGFARRRIWPPPIRGPMTVFFPVFGVCPTGVGGGQIRAGSVRGGNAPLRQLGEADRGFGHRQIWPPPIRGPMTSFFPVLGVYPSGVGGGQTRAGSVRGGNNSM
jgi:hypothetical protein